MDEALQTLKKWLNESRRTVFFGGAGVSTESGIPDFRSKDGLYHQRYAYPPEQILSHTFFFARTEEFYRFYRDKMLCLDKKPNAAHLKLAALESGGLLSCVITQNIDGLHQAAGSSRVLELHGSIHQNACIKCGRAFTAEEIKRAALVPLCPCGGLIKPNVVLYEEALDERVTEQALHELSRAELLIVGGTSLSVYPAAGFLSAFNGAHLILINRDPTPRDLDADLVIREPIGEVFSKI